MSVRTRPLPPYALVDLAAVVTLAVLALAGFWTTFGGSGWLVVAGIGLALGLGWTLLLVSLRQGMDLVMETLVFPYLLTAGAVALRTPGLLLGIPSLEVLNDVIVGSVTSWRRLAETAPPVDSAGPVLLIPYALACVLPAVAAAIALRSRRPVLPVLPLLLMLAVVLVLGLREPVSLLVQGAGFGAVALAWTAHRGLRAEAGRRADPARVPPARVAWVVLVVGAVAALTLAVTPTAAPGRVVVRERVAAFDSASLDTPLSAFRRFRPQEVGSYNNVAETKLFRVKGAEAGTRVRVAVLDRYDGHRWYAAADASAADVTDRFLRIGSRVDNPAPGAEQTFTFYVRGDWGLPWVPTIGAPQAFSFYGDHRGRRLGELRLNRATDTAVLPDGLRIDQDYLLTSIPLPERLTERMKPWRTPTRELRAAAKFLDVPARAWSAGAGSPMEAVFAIAERLRERGRYSNGAFGWETRFPAGQDAGRLGDGFVNAPIMVGNDEQYAATMALLANRIGVPARVAVGTVLGKNGVIKGRHLDAWVEIRVANGSWRVLPTRAFMSHRPPDQDEEPLARVRLPRRPSAPPPVTRPEVTPPPPPQEQPTEPPAAEDPAQPLPRWPLLLLVPAALAGVPVAKLVRRRRRRSASPAWLGYAGGWDELVDTGRDLGVAVRPGTRPAQAAALALDPALARAADVAVFSADDPATAADFWELVDAERGALAARVPRWRRLLAPLNPASLLRR